MKALILVVVCVFAVACDPPTNAQLRAADRIAQNLCALHHAERDGSSFADAVKKHCSAKREYQPWLDTALDVHEIGEAATGEGGSK